VIVHIHDIFIRRNTPKAGSTSPASSGTSKYLVQAFLAFNKQFEVLWASHFMHLTHTDKNRSGVSVLRKDALATECVLDEAGVGVRHIVSCRQKYVRAGASSGTRHHVSTTIPSIS